MRVEEAEAELPLGEVSDELLAELARLEPHGAANPRPVFLARDATATGPFSPVGSSGLSGRLHAGRRDLRCVAWQPGPELAGLASARAPMDLLFRVAAGRNGYRPEVEVLGARLAESPP